MKKMNVNKLIIAPMLFAALALGACSQNQNDEGVQASSDVPQENEGPQSGTIGGGGASGVNSSNTQGTVVTGGANNNPNDNNDISLAGLNDPNNLLSQRIIYFDYNQSAIRPEYMVLINTHAKLAAKFPNLKMRLEGHADERGSREYNVALSEARAQSVKRIMGARGARSGQIRTIGYGEEVPVVRGHSQESWQKNRRVEIKYDGH